MRGEENMAYIPEQHKKYSLLPNGFGEVFHYHTDLFDQWVDSDEKYFYPYGYDSYEEFYADLDVRIAQLKNTETAILLQEFKEELKRINIKENWSVLKYLGDDPEFDFGLTKGQYYYWPCSIENPEYAGVIDNEEFTGYHYPVDAEMWEIAEDPTGMAHRSIYGDDRYNHERKWLGMILGRNYNQDK